MLPSFFICFRLKLLIIASFSIGGYNYIDNIKTFKFGLFWGLNSELNRNY